jgi:hypothetical protein
VLDPGHGHGGQREHDHCRGHDRLERLHHSSSDPG